MRQALPDASDLHMCRLGAAANLELRLGSVLLDLDRARVLQCSKARPSGSSLLRRERMS